MDGGPIPSWPALLAALISVISKEWIYRYTAKVARDYKSGLLMAREEIIQLLQERIPQLQHLILSHHTRLHYLKGKILVELLLSENNTEDLSDLQQELNALADEYSGLKEIKVWRALK